MRTRSSKRDTRNATGTGHGHDGQERHGAHIAMQTGQSSQGGAVRQSIRELRRISSRRCSVSRSLTNALCIGAVDVFFFLFEMITLPLLPHHDVSNLCDVVILD